MNEPSPFSDTSISITKAPVIGRPCESTAVPLIDAVRTGNSANVTPLTSPPSPTVTRSACCELPVPG